MCTVESCKKKSLLSPNFLHNSRIFTVGGFTTPIVLDQYNVSQKPNESLNWELGLSSQKLCNKYEVVHCLLTEQNEYQVPKLTDYASLNIHNQTWMTRKSTKHRVSEWIWIRSHYQAKDYCRMKGDHTLQNKLNTH